MKYSMRFFLMLLFIVVTPIYGFGATYYASPTGSGTGTSSSPCSLSSGLSKLAPGDTLYLRGGTYKPAGVSFSKSGTSESARVTIAGYPGETAILDGQNVYPTGGSAYWFATISGNYVTVRDLTIRNTRGAGLGAKGSYSKIINIKMNHSGASGIVVTGHYGLIDGCEVSDNGWMYTAGLSSTWGSAMAMFAGATGGVIQNSKSHDNRGEGISTYNGTRNTIIQDNVSYNNKSYNLYLDSVTDAIVRRNLVYDSGTASPARGIVIAREWSSPNPSNIQIYNNLVYGTFVNLQLSNQASSMTNVTIAHNTFINAKGGSGGYNMGVYVKDTAYSNCTFKDNVVIEESSTRVPIVISAGTELGMKFSYNGWNKTPVAGARGVGDITGDLKLAKAGYTSAGQLKGTYFALTSTSPLINRGSVVSGVTTDYFKTARPQGGAVDIGGHEYGTSGSGTVALTAPTSLRVVN